MNAIFFKEWIKTRWYLLLTWVVSLGFILYTILRINRAVELKGAAHIWEVMITRDAIFVELLAYVPVILGIVFALVQFMPEMYHKCLKLTLHLPYAQLKMTNMMLIYGIVALASCFAVNFFILYLYLQSFLAQELYARVLITALPWFIAGVCAYLLMSWICLEPTWKMRMFNLLVSVFVLRIFFLTMEPAAYIYFLPGLAIYSLMTICLSWISINRFKSGKQD